MLQGEDTNHGVRPPVIYNACKRDSNIKKKPSAGTTHFGRQSAVDIRSPKAPEIWFDVTSAVEFTIGENDVIL